MFDARARLLLLRGYLLEHTDERHGATAREIIAHLELAGYSVDRRGVYADIELLRESGLDVRVRRRRANEYYIGSRIFERSELRLLTDMIRASRVLSRERSEAMIEKLTQLGAYGDPLRDPNRHTRVQPIRWREDGTPDFGTPLPETPAAK